MKPIIAVTLVNLFVSSTPWKKAHENWFYRVSHELSDESYFQWIKKENYFDGIEAAMEELMPDSSDEDKLTEARRRYFELVIAELNKGFNLDTNAVAYFKALKADFRIALITTIDSAHIRKILTLLNLNDLFDIIETTLSFEKDDVSPPFRRFLEKYGSPEFYVASSDKNSEFCSKHNINFILTEFNQIKKLEKEISSLN